MCRLCACNSVVAGPWPKGVDHAASRPARRSGPLCRGARLWLCARAGDAGYECAGDVGDAEWERQCYRVWAGRVLVPVRTTSASYGSATTHRSLAVNDHDPHPVSEPVSLLSTQLTSYHFRLCARNAGQTNPNCGGDRLFTTAPVAGSSRISLTTIAAGTPAGPCALRASVGRGPIVRTTPTGRSRPASSVAIRVDERSQPAAMPFRLDTAGVRLTSRSCSSTSTDAQLASNGVLHPRRDPALSSSCAGSTTGASSTSQHVERHRRRHERVRRVHELRHAQLHRRAHQHVRGLALQAVLVLEPAEHLDAARAGWRGSGRAARCARRRRAGCPWSRSRRGPAAAGVSQAGKRGRQPSRRRPTRTVALPPVSIAEMHTSPSPWAKWRSPSDSSAPGTCTGSSSRLPTTRSRTSMLPPFSRGG